VPVSRSIKKCIPQLIEKPGAGNEKETVSDLKFASKKWIYFFAMDRCFLLTQAF
jgi:hypothetical protein